MQPLLLAIMVIMGMVLGYKLNDNPPSYTLAHAIDADAVEIGRVEEILRFIDNKYVDIIDDDVLLEKAINAMLTELDPHSIYIPPDRVKEINSQMQGKYVGLGIETLMVDDTLRVIQVLKDSPASRIHLKSGDAILSIDDTLVSGVDRPYNNIRSLMLKEYGEVVNLGVVQNQEEKKLELKLDEIPLISTEIGFMLDDETAYIKIDKFTSETYREFAAKLENLIDGKKSSNLIIDLRGNPGGFLPETTKILSQIIAEKNSLLVYTEGRNQLRLDYKSSGRNFYDIDKVAVLIDEGSASGSEIVAGAIQDWDRGIVVGRPSYGKGLVQEQYDLANGGAIRLTIAKYFTPSGRCIQKPYADHEYIENAESDSNSYSTLIRRRPVWAHGGIHPDLEIAMDSLYYTDRYTEIMSLIDILAFRKAFQSDDRWNKIDISDMSARLGIEYEDLLQHQGFLNSVLDTRMVYMKDGPIPATELSAETDVFISETLKLFKEGHPLDALGD